MAHRVRAWVNRYVNWSLAAMVVVAVLVGAPGYLRQETAIHTAKDAAERAQSAAEQAAGAADQAGDATDEAKRAIAQANDAIAQIVAQRTESRIKLCEKDQRFAVAHNLGFGATVDAFSKFVSNLGELSKRPDNPEQNAAIDAEVKRQTDLFAAKVNAAKVDVPDCSPAGIAKAYDGETP